ncbi:MAG: hypothetical protein ACR2P4_00985 [Gammaproteobacteria bacterium]
MSFPPLLSFPRKRESNKTPSFRRKPESPLLPPSVWEIPAYAGMTKGGNDEDGNSGFFARRGIFFGEFDKTGFFVL